MEGFLAYFCYFGVVLLLNLTDYRRYKTLLNPLFMLSMPFSLIVVICALFNKSMDFVPLYPPCLWVWTGGLLMFWVCQFIYGRNHAIPAVKLEYAVNELKYNNKAIGYTIFNIIVVFAILFGLFRLASFGMGSYGSKSLGAEMGKGGIVGRIANLLILALPFYLASYYKWTRKMAFGLAIFIVILSFGSKTWAQYSILASFIVCFLMGRKIKIKYVIFGVLILFSLFVLYYRLLVDIPDNERFFQFVVRHFYFYLTSGLLPMSEYFSQELVHHQGGITFPIFNIFNSWMGESIGSGHSSFWVVTDLWLHNRSNVMSFFGTLWIEGGVFDYVFYSLFCGIISYGVFYVFRRSPNIFSAIAHAFTLCVLFFGFFNWGFGILRVWEIYIYCIIFNGIRTLKRNQNAIKTPNNKL